MHFFILLVYVIPTAFFFEDIPGVDIQSEQLLNARRINEQPIKYKDHEPDFHLLKEGTAQILTNSGRRNRLEIFCYAGEEKTFVNILKTVQIKVNVPNDDFHYYLGQNASAVRKEFEEASWINNLVLWKSGTFNLNYYKRSCVGIETSESFRAALSIRYLDFWRLIALLVGVALFTLSPILSRNVVFHYATGVGVGVFGSLLVIVYLLSRLFPKKSAAATVAVGGWSVVIYILQYFWINITTVLKEYNDVLVGYVVIAGLMSFVLVYRFGPITDIRSLQLVQWTLQVAALLTIFYSSICREFSLTVCLVLLGQHNFPECLKRRLRNYWLKAFPPAPQLLSEEEYLEQSRVETKKALDELRKYCQSPECKPWKTMSRLETPKRFAEFVEGSSHLLDEEILAYECDFTKHSEDLLTDDESSESS